MFNVSPCLLLRVCLWLQGDGGALRSGSCLISFGVTIWKRSWSGGVEVGPSGTDSLVNEKIFGTPPARSAETDTPTERKKVRATQNMDEFCSSSDEGKAGLDPLAAADEDSSSQRFLISQRLGTKKKRPRSEDRERDHSRVQEADPLVQIALSSAHLSGPSNALLPMTAGAHSSEAPRHSAWISSLG
ncbi:hypothetical protein cypCar_00023866 [Cyprinus carpio]|nr:hypothetical protein cypCar_00023866 [Cyprinus carpio]